MGIIEEVTLNINVALLSYSLQSHMHKLYNVNQSHELFRNRLINLSCSITKFLSHLIAGFLLNPIYFIAAIKQLLELIYFQNNPEDVKIPRILSVIIDISIFYYAFTSLSTTFASLHMILISVALIKYSYFYIQRRQKKYPPKMPNWLPFIGQIRPFWQNPYMFLQENHKSYGDIFSCELTTKLVTFVNSPELQKNVLNAKEEVLSQREPLKTLIGKWIPPKMFTALPKRTFNFLKSTQKCNERYEYINCYKFTEEWVRDNFKEESDIHLFKLTYKYVMSFLCQFFCGDEFRKDYSEQIIELFDIVEGNYDIFTMMSPIETDMTKKKKKAVETLITLFNNIGGHYLEMSDPLMNAIDEDIKEMNTEKVTGEIFTGLFFGAATNVSSSLPAVISQLISHPEILKKVRDEQNAIFTDGVEFNNESMNKMDYLNRVLLETMRLAGNGVMWRQAMDEYKLDEWTIEKGSWIAVPMSPTNYNDNSYPNPNVFDPDRFQEDNMMNVQRTVSSPNYRSFGGGRHVCPGRILGFNIVKMGVSEIVRNYDFQFFKTPTFRWVPGPGVEHPVDGSDCKITKV